MSDSLNSLDLELWSNEELIRKQNRLKFQFREILADLGNLFPNDQLSQLHSQSRGKKITQGQDLMGLPYQVLDLVRDFDFQTGLNIRILNWFGKGVFIFVLCGQKSHYEWDLSPIQFQLCKSESPWDYPDILEKKNEASPPSEYRQWFKELMIFPESAKTINCWENEIKKILEALGSFLDKREK